MSNDAVLGPRLEDTSDKIVLDPTNSTDPTAAPLGSLVVPDSAATSSHGPSRELISALDSGAPLTNPHFRELLSLVKRNAFTLSATEQVEITTTRSEERRIQLHLRNLHGANLLECLTAMVGDTTCIRPDILGLIEETQLEDWEYEGVKAVLIIGKSADGSEFAAFEFEGETEPDPRDLVSAILVTAAAFYYAKRAGIDFRASDADMWALDTAADTDTDTEPDWLSRNQEALEKLPPIIREMLILLGKDRVNIYACSARIETNEENHPERLFVLY